MPAVHRGTPLILLPALAAVAGCNSGRINALYIFDQAVVAEDARADYQRSVVLRDGQVTPQRGRLVPPSGPGGWLVFAEKQPILRQVRTSPMRPEQRLPAWAADHRLRCFDLATGAVTTLPNPYDSDDEHIRMLRVVRDRLYAAVEQRFNVPEPGTAPRYYAYTLPAGPWEPLRDAEGRRVFPRNWVPSRFVDARTGAEPPTREAAARAHIPATDSTPLVDELRRRGLAPGPWGNVFERTRGTGRETVFQAPDGRETVLLRQNDAGYGAVSPLDLSVREGGRRGP